MSSPKISVALLIMRLTIAGFFGAWTSLKFYRPEWFENVFTNNYGLDFITRDMSTYVGILQAAICVLFVIGMWRTLSYGALVLMQGAGIWGSLSNLMNYTNYPNNLMLAAVPAFGAVLALWILRDLDTLTVDGMRSRARANAALHKATRAL